MKHLGRIVHPQPIGFAATNEYTVGDLETEKERGPIKWGAVVVAPVVFPSINHDGILILVPTGVCQEENKNKHNNEKGPVAGAFRQHMVTAREGSVTHSIFCVTLPRPFIGWHMPK
jgi:hypothetical protein